MQPARLALHPIAQPHRPSHRHGRRSMARSLRGHGRSCGGRCGGQGVRGRRGLAGGCFGRRDRFCFYSNIFSWRAGQGLISCQNMRRLRSRRGGQPCRRHGHCRPPGWWGCTGRRGGGRCWRRCGRGHAAGQQAHGGRLRGRGLPAHRRRTQKRQVHQQHSQRQQHQPAPGRAEGRGVGQRAEAGRRGHGQAAAVMGRAYGMPTPRPAPAGTCRQ